MKQQISEKIDKELVADVCDHLLYLEGDRLDLFIHELKDLISHYKLDKKPNYDISSFKIPLEKAI